MRRPNRPKATHLFVRILIAALFFFAALPTLAIEEDALLWLTGTGQVELPAEFEATLFVQTRFADDISEFERVVINPSIGRSLGHGFAAALGYDAHIIRTPRTQVEHRSWQQIVFGHALLKAKIQHRIRLEERFIEHVDGAAMRLRYLLGGDLPILSSDWRAVLRNEVFLDLNSKSRGPQSGFGETRLFAGFDRALGPTAGIEVGYQLQYVDRPRRDVAKHTLSIAIRFAP